MRPLSRIAAPVAASGLDIFIGGGGDDLAWLGFGVVRAYAGAYAAATGRPTAYSPNGRVRRLARRLRRLGGPVPLNIIGHSWGALDAFALTVRLERAGLSVNTLITLDPVGWPLGRRPKGLPNAFWLNVACAPSRPDDSDRLTQLPPWSRKPSGLPTEQARRCVELDANHWNVEAMMELSGARERLQAAWGAAESKISSGQFQ